MIAMHTKRMTIKRMKKTIAVAKITSNLSQKTNYCLKSCMPAKEEPRNMMKNFLKYHHAMCMNAQINS